MEHKVRVYTLGCRLNSLESEAIAESFKKNGFVLTDDLDAELYVVNSCTVTSKAEQKARRMVRLFSKTSLCIVTGCYAEVSHTEIEKISENTIVITNKNKPKLLRLPEHLANLLHKNGTFLKSDIEAFFTKETDSVEANQSQFDFFTTNFSHHSRALLKIQDGCDRYCAFCRTSIARGNPVSLNSDEVLRRIENLQKNGAKEVVLTGVNLALYSHNGINLSALLRKILPYIDNDVLLRLSSLEPDLIDDDFFSTVSDERIAGYFHLPLQSLSSKVLSLCGRKYDASKIDDIIKKLRVVKKDPFISADIIAGLPGEEDEDFSITYDFLSSHKLSYLHVFPYSVRPGTRFDGVKHSSQSVRDRRAEMLRLLSNSLYRQYYDKFKGKSLNAIAEDCNGEYQYFTSSNYLKLRRKLSDFPKIPKGSRVVVEVE